MYKLIVTKGVKEYRNTIPHCVCKSDLVLEIGFAWGTTTNLLSQVCKKVVGMDKGSSYYKAIRDYPQIEFHKIDGFNISEVLNLNYDFNKIYIDISGCRGIFDVLKMVQMYKGAFNPDLIVVKSSRLKTFLKSCEIFSL